MLKLHGIKLLLQYLYYLGQGFHLISFHSLTQSPKITRADNLILITQSSLWTSYRIKYMML